MVEKWEKLDSKPVTSNRIFRLRQDTSRSPRTGDTHRFFVIESEDWINVIPITREGKVVLIHQFRHGTREVTVEIPGGIVDSGDDSSLTSATRELAEETGYVADQLIHIGSVTPNPAFLNNQCHTFLALDARLQGDTQFDSAEDIQVEERDLEEIPSLISSGKITHSLVIAAFYHFDRFRVQNPDWRPGRRAAIP
jgi:8-oxo-dGTP pyrophosphatase MutT (NUDIX family)